VHEVGVVAWTQAIEQGAGALDAQRIPTHVRDRTAARRREAVGVSGDDAEAVRLAFLRRFEQQLHPQANAEHGLLQRWNQGVQFLLPQARHRIRRRAHSGQDHVRGLANLF